MRWITAVLVLAGCGETIANTGFEIDYGGQPCEWVVIEGSAGLTGWHDGDPALDLSNPGKVVVEQRAFPVQLSTRELLLEAAVVRAPGVNLRFELEWHQGATVDIRPVEIDQTGVFRLRKLVSTPSLAVDGLVFRVVKDGQGEAIVDEIALSEYFGEPVR